MPEPDPMTATTLPQAAPARMTPDRRAEIESHARTAVDFNPNHSYSLDYLDLLAELRAVEAERGIAQEGLTAAIKSGNDRLKGAEEQYTALRTRLPTPEMVRKAADNVTECAIRAKVSQEPIGSKVNEIAAIIAAALGVDMSRAAPTIPAPAPEPKGEGECQ